MMMESLLESSKCGDCSNKTLSWVSLNKLLFLCNDCARLHVDMGRHVSNVRSARGIRHSSEVKLLQALHSTSNAIWEHTLTDSQNGKTFRKRPEPGDVMFPVKSDFVRAKHVHNAFTFRFEKKDQNQSAADTELELSEQLHAAVRTQNLETSLRLIACGADPNYCHPEKGLPTLHVATLNNQVAQVELLFVYGADIGALDNAGKLASEVAEECGHTELADRLIEMQYHVTDKFAWHSCGKIPDHKKGIHFIVPRVDLAMEHYSSSGRPKMQLLSNETFAELAMDVYDEIDRRELELVWKTLYAENPDFNFPSQSLQVVSELPGNRNALRRRLSKLNPTEFTVFVIDILKEAERRYHGEKVPTAYSDDEPLYDHVASEDYFPIDAATPHFYSEPHDALLSHPKFPDATNLSQETSLHIQQQLAASNAKMETLLRSNEGMQQQMKALHDAVDKILKDNSSIKGSSLPPKPAAIPQKPAELKMRNPEPLYYKPVDDLSPTKAQRNSGPHTTPSPRTHRPMSMFEPRKTSAQLPTNTEVSRLTGVVTTSVKEFKFLIDCGRNAELSIAAERVVGAVLNVLAAFPNSVKDINLEKALLKLSRSVGNLQSACKEFTSSPTVLDHQQISQKLYPCSFEILLACKSVLSHYQLLSV